MRFDVNPTDIPMLINLGTSTYKDVYGTTYSGTYTLEPYGSRILQSFSLTTISTTIDNHSDSRLMVYPTPNANSEPLKLEIYSTAANTSNIRILSINGEVLYSKQEKLSEGTTKLELPSLKKGVYLLESISSNGKSIVTKFIQ
jgi:hypothetical protein